MTLQRDLTPEEHDRFMKSTIGEPITSFKVYETNMINEKELREEWEKYKKDMEGRPYAGDPFLDFFLSKFHSHTKEVIEKIKKWAEQNSEEISDSYPFPSSYDQSDFTSLPDLLAFLASLEDNKK